MDAKTGKVSVCVGAATTNPIISSNFEQLKKLTNISRTNKKQRRNEVDYDISGYF